ncbi:LysM peptidoglycan-binding domain-containing protein [Anaerosolibacter sp.]|uniref:LysM peptidoglycan-binding domain-containing protein n=1 Tax=Anaerosolibacter sp. TaxID=1872527 RepID=UPI00261EE3F3|nr:LysM peptidoglycan-binding domain-containing protein [Anaerosolibacter sp.]
MMRQPTAPLGSFNYTIEVGDTLYGIARKFNTTISNIRIFNYIPNPDIIYVGQVLTIPESPAEAIIYTVQPGDTLNSIARAHGTYVNNLIIFNYLTHPDLIYPGQQLVVTASLR